MYAAVCYAVRSDLLSPTLTQTLTVTLTLSRAFQSKNYVEGALHGSPNFPIGKGSEARVKVRVNVRIAGSG
jgi:hypothetical protein